MNDPDVPSDAADEAYEGDHPLDADPPANEDVAQLIEEGESFDDGSASLEASRKPLESFDQGEGLGSVDGASVSRQPISPDLESIISGPDESPSIQVRVSFAALLFLQKLM